MVPTPAEQKVDLAKAAERLAEAQEGVKLAHSAYQTCTKAWDGIHGPSDAKRAMWKALEHARASLTSAMRQEARHFGVMQTIVGQGDLFNGDGESDNGDGLGVQPTPPPPGGDSAGPASTAIARRPPKRRGRGSSSASVAN